MNVKQLSTINELENFISGTQVVAFCVKGNPHTAIYQEIENTLFKFEYFELNKHDKGIVVQYLMKITAYSRQQIVRLIKQYRETRKIIFRQRTVDGFKKKYKSVDIRLLAQLDDWHSTLSGPATKKLCERVYQYFEQQEYKQLAEISVSHLYNLRQSNAYKQQRWNYEKTKSTRASGLGERRKPNPEGKPGYIRIDTVHEGDFDREKGVYHINAVDEVAQFEVVCTVEKISEQYLIPILEMLLDCFRFTVLGFHSDNGSEYVNQHVVKLLRKLFIEFTKSCARHSNDNALAESKNGSIVRKVLGYAHIPQRWANEVNEFNKLYLNPYINFHRPLKPQFLSLNQYIESLQKKGRYTLKIEICLIYHLLLNCSQRWIFRK